MVTNTQVITPLGKGVAQGPYEVRDGKGETVGRAVLVRLPINDVTRPALHQSNCLTPNAERSGLWTFDVEAVSS